LADEADRRLASASRMVEGADPPLLELLAVAVLGAALPLLPAMVWNVCGWAEVDPPLLPLDPPSLASEASFCSPAELLVATAPLLRPVLGSPPGALAPMLELVPVAACPADADVDDEGVELLEALEEGPAAAVAFDAAAAFELLALLAVAAFEAFDAAVLDDELEAVAADEAEDVAAEDGADDVLLFEDVAFEDVACAAMAESA
jgi:hypothetical protein